MAGLPGALARFFPLPSDVIAEYVEGAEGAGSAPSSGEGAGPAGSKEGAEGDGAEEATGDGAARATGDGAAKATGDGAAKATTGGGKTYTDHALPLPLLARLLSTLLSRLGALRAALAASELRAVGASLLVVYEGDAVRLASSFAALDDGRVRWKEDAEVDDTSSSGSDDDDDADKADKPTLPLTLHLIDFAHTVPTPGQGPDQGVLLGLDHFMGLVEGRLALVRAALAREGADGADGDEREPKKARTETATT